MYVASELMYLVKALNGNWFDLYCGHLFARDFSLIPKYLRWPVRDSLSFIPKYLRWLVRDFPSFQSTCDGQIEISLCDDESDCDKGVGGWQEGDEEEEEGEEEEAALDGS